MNSSTQPLRITDPVTGAVCLTLRHKSGMEIRIAPQPEFRTAAAMLCVRFGSVHRRFRIGSREYTVPAGTAHFLEHKLFETEGEDAEVLFSRLGAADNAYTSFDRTVFYFQTQRNFPAALRLLLGTVKEPVFSAKSVAAEREIIAQEIREFAVDEPDDRLFFTLTEGLYHRHPIRCDVAGTAESITQITPQILRRCHAAFYRPENMILCCAGPVDAADILAAADAAFPAHAPRPPAVLCPPEEPEAPAAPYRETVMAVSKPQFSFGFKSAPAPPELLLRETLLAELTAGILAGPASPLYQRLLREGLINDTFSAGAVTGADWFIISADGESDDPRAAAAVISEEIGKLIQTGIDPERFLIHRRAAYGDALLSVSTPAAAADAMLETCMLGMQPPFARTEILPALTPEDANRLLRERLLPQMSCLAVLKPDGACQPVHSIMKG